GPARVGLGGGVVADSVIGDEWAEVGIKGQFLAADSTLERPGLIETMGLGMAGEIPWLERHLARLAASARALGIPLDDRLARDMIEEQRAVRAARGEMPWVVRLVLAADGTLSVTGRPPGVPPPELRVCLGGPVMDRRDGLLRHKTTRRASLDQALAAARAAGCDDVLLRNGLGRVTEGTVRAVLVRLAGRWYAPPLTEGLLPSLWRETELARLGGRERPLTLEDLQGAEAIRMGNGVQGGRPVRRLEDADGTLLWEAPT
ncbi:MAG: aminotransferase class IV, partial [Magnetococcales bacterium]|nr:aminotransferase class IV [Magnetococcales bacterium]